MSSSHSRLIAADDEKDLDNDSPILGLDLIPLLSLEETLTQAAVTLVELSASDVKTMMASAKRKVKKLKKTNQLRPLSEEEAKALNFYTQDSNMYKKLNELLMVLL